MDIRFDPGTRVPIVTGLIFAWPSTTTKTALSPVGIVTIAASGNMIERRVSVTISTRPKRPGLSFPSTFWRIARTLSARPSMLTTGSSALMTPV